MTTSPNFAQALASGNRGVPWLIYLPTLVVALAIANEAADPAIRWYALSIVFVAVTVAWYFVVARIPNAALVRRIRRQVAGDAVVVGVAVSPNRSGQISARAVASITALVADSRGIELWGGSGDSSRPLISAQWVELKLSASTRGTRVELALGGQNLRLTLKVYSSRFWGRSTLRGRRLAELVDRISGQAGSRTL